MKLIRLAIKHCKKIVSVLLIMFVLITPGKGFAGEDYKTLIIVTANYDTDICLNKNAGYTFLVKRKTGGKKPYLFG